ncbi:MAG: alpha/beta hydrolase [Acidimicrobiia bacterium]|nr:alpha/beta hydrolase [Acidimicrobiia bacterium]MBT8214336.1 alpha/beta hydrolase [Acidimicrobiia bacterium]NNF69264.1 alpha/beta hydrolase [Acidimicrobiia bacterium]NNK91559.1 alpha/beta hydrolase [Acidimicrobiia bacterium]
MKRFLAFLALAWAGWRLLGPREAPRFSGVQRRPIKVPGRTVFVGQREFMVRRSGIEGGPPLVLIHGWLFDSESMFYSLVPHLTDQFDVIMIDHRGHGKTDRMGDRYDIEDAADDLAAVIATLDVGPVTVFGYSMGGLIAQSLALRHPGLVERMVLAATSAHPVPSARIGFRVILNVLRAIDRLSPTEGSWVGRFILRQRGSLDPEHDRFMWEMLQHRDQESFHEAGCAIWRFDSRDWVRRLKAPSLVVIPTHDEVMPSPLQYQLASLRPERVVELAGVGHESIVTRPAEYAKAISAFWHET